MLVAASAVKVSAGILLIASGSAAQDTCRRPAPYTAIGEVITLTTTRGFPCAIQFSDTPTELRTSDSDVIDIAQPLFRAPDGKLYTYASQGGQISVWAPDGRFIRSFGREGRGPGEFLRGFKSILFDTTGAIYVADNQRRWAVFSAAHEYVRTVGGTAGSVLPDNAVFLRDGSMLATVAYAADRQNAFRILRPPTAPPSGTALAADDKGSSPEVVRSFGTPGAGAAAAFRERRIAYGGGNSFWVAPPDGARMGYVLEQWRTDGTLLRTIRRTVPWFPSEPGLVGPPSTVDGAKTVIPPPEIETFQNDGSDLLFVRLMIPNKNFRNLGPDVRDPARRRALQDEMVDIYIEVIDGRAAKVLASLGPLRPSVASEKYPGGFFPGSRLGYRVYSLPDGNRAARIVAYSLVAN